MRERPTGSWLPLGLPERDGPLKLLCLGAHADDLEIGCGGTLLRLTARESVSVRWVVFAASDRRKSEARESAGQLLESAASSTIEVFDFGDGFFPAETGALKEAFEGLKADDEPDLIFTHFCGDRHQDHRTIGELTWQTFRRHLILEYEVLKYDGRGSTPNVYVELDDALARRKVGHLTEFFPSQLGRHWFDEDAFYADMRLSGVECGVRYAEAFLGRKLVLAL